jgi:hypothetical protein
MQTQGFAKVVGERWLRFLLGGQQPSRTKLKFWIQLAIASKGNIIP